MNSLTFPFADYAILDKIAPMLDAEISSADESPDKRLKLASFQDERETSAGLYPDQMGLFLWRLVPHISEDFGGDQIQRLIRVADSMALEETRQIQLMITFRGRRTPFLVRIYKYAAEASDAVALYIKTNSVLVGVFEDELKIFFGPPAGEPGAADAQEPLHRRIHIQDS
jgi:hypothetical protein